ncbi:MAG TPA: phosphoglycerate kinase, partial [Candidatus Poseidoniales archaeon]|nr:phosphoglycerate kinase [Candidatus Poseidoniales archaeon]
MEIDGLDDLGLSGAVVLLRVDINAPIDPRTGTFLDERRILEIMPTLDRLAGNPVVMLAHQSRPGKADYTSLAPHARAISHMMKRNVQLSQDLHHAPDTLERIRNLQPSEILLLDNVRFLAEEIALSRAPPEQM